jgi:large subunit ribosomal protein L15
MPLSRRVPKFGFTNHNRIEYQEVNVSRLQELVDSSALNDKKVNAEILYNLKVIRNRRQPLKILGNGEIKTALEITADAFTESAKSKIQSIGGTVIING